MGAYWTWMVALAVLIHIVINVVLWLCQRGGILRISGQLLVLSLLVPVWGLVIIFIAEWDSRRGKVGCRGLQVDLLELSDEDLRSAHLTEDKDENKVIPLEEAILINDAKTRRQLMIDILRQSPEQYVDLLQKARMNDDAEVMHYAATAMMELQRDYDLKLQKCDHELSLDPDNFEVLETYRTVLKQYIASGLLSGNTLHIQRVRYRVVLSKRMALEEAGPQIYCDAADNELELQDGHAAKALIGKAMEKWPQNEALWMMLLKFYVAQRDGEAVKRTVRQMEEKRIYLSPAGREKVEFFMNA